MTSVISVVTAVYRPVRDYLLAAYESLCGQEMPPGWDWQWVVQEDDQPGALAGILPADERISPGDGRHFGLATTRNMCLSRATGSLIKTLDADDQLLPGTLARDIRVLDSRGDVGWTVCQALDLLPDGSTVRFWGPPEGLLDQGEIHRHWQAHGYQLPVHPATLCINRRLLAALGGWMAIPDAEDTGLLFAAGIVARGYYIAEPGLLYRKWSGQLTAQPSHFDPVERSARRAVLQERVQALESFMSGNVQACSRVAVPLRPADLAEEVRTAPSRVPEQRGGSPSERL